MSSTQSTIGDMTQSIAAHLEWMRDEHYGETSIQDRGKILRLAARRLPRGLYDVWPHEIGSFLHRPGLSAWTSHTYYSHLSGFYRWAAELGEITYDPTEDVPTPTGGQARPKPVASDELHLALTRSSDMWRTAIILAVGAGLLASEIADLERGRDALHVVERHRYAPVQSAQHPVVRLIEHAAERGAGHAAPTHEGEYLADDMIG